VLEYSLYNSWSCRSSRGHMWMFESANYKVLSDTFVRFYVSGHKMSSGSEHQVNTAPDEQQHEIWHHDRVCTAQAKPKFRSRV